MKKFKGRGTIVTILILATVFSLSMTAFAAGTQVASYSALRVGPDYRGTSTPSFYISTGTIYDYNSFSSGVPQPAGTIDVWLYSVDNATNYSKNTITISAGTTSKDSTLYWTSVPPGTYQLVFISSTIIGNNSGTVYNGPK